MILGSQSFQSPGPGWRNKYRTCWPPTCPSPITPGLRRAACNTGGYLLARGDARTAHELAGNLRQQWCERLGDSHENTLMATTLLASTLQALGRYTGARDLD